MTFLCALDSMLTIAPTQVCISLVYASLLHFQVPSKFFLYMWQALRSLPHSKALRIRHLQYGILCEFCTASDERARPGNKAIEKLGGK